MSDFDDAYANAVYIDGAEQYPVDWADRSARLRKDWGEHAQLDVSYGPSQRQAYDLFHPVEKSKGTLIFVHGGFWRAFDRSYWSFLAEGALKQGWTVAIPSYDLCPEVRIAGITQQIAQAVQVIAARVDGPISLAGHSAGGHLVARMLAPGMLPKKIVERLHHIVPISPLSDLEPLCKTAMNGDFQMDREMAKAESPLLQPAPASKVSVWVGELERPAFLDQAMWLTDAWECALVLEAGKHHFDVINGLSDPTSTIIQRLTS